jgi:hypothetical protein
MNALVGQIVFPAIFLIVAALNPRNMMIKGVCIILAYFSVIFLNGGMSVAPVADGITNTSPFGLLLLVISLWGFILVGSGTGKTGKKDNSQ